MLLFLNVIAIFFASYNFHASAADDCAEDVPFNYAQDVPFMQEAIAQWKSSHFSGSVNRALAPHDNCSESPENDLLPAYVYKKQKRLNFELRKSLAKVARRPSQFNDCLNKLFEKQHDLLSVDLQQMHTQIDLDCDTLVHALAHIDKSWIMIESQIAIAGLIQIGAFIHSPHCPKENTLDLLAKLYPCNTLLVQYLPNIFKAGYLLQYMKNLNVECAYDLHDISATLSLLSKKYPTLQDLLKFLHPFAINSTNPLASICRKKPKFSDFRALIITPYSKDEISDHPHNLCMEGHCCPLKIGFKCNRAALCKRHTSTSGVFTLRKMLLNNLRNKTRVMKKFNTSQFSRASMLHPHPDPHSEKTPLEPSSDLERMPSCDSSLIEEDEKSSFLVSFPRTALSPTSCYVAPLEPSDDLERAPSGEPSLEEGEIINGSLPVSLRRTALSPMSYCAVPAETAQYLQMQLNNILHAPNKAFEVVQEIYKEVPFIECSDSCTTIWSMLAHMLGETPRSLAPIHATGLIAIGELCAFILEGHPDFSASLLKEIHKIYPTPMLVRSIYRKSPSYINLAHTRTLIKLTHVLQNIITHLVKTPSSLEMLIQELDVDPHNAETALRETFTLLSSSNHALLPEHCKKGLSTSVCRNKLPHNSILLTLQSIEENKDQQTLIPFVNPYVSDTVVQEATPTDPSGSMACRWDCISGPFPDQNVSLIPYLKTKQGKGKPRKHQNTIMYNTLVEILDDPSLAHTLIYNLCIQINESISEKDSVSQILSQTLEKFMPYGKYDAEVTALAALADVYTFCFANPPLKTSLVHIASNLFPTTVTCITKKIRHIRQLVKLSYVLQNLITPIITSADDLLGHLEDLKIGDLPLQKCLNLAIELLPLASTSALKNPTEPGAATRLCKLFSKVDETLFFLHTLETSQCALKPASAV